MKYIKYKNNKEFILLLTLQRTFFCGFINKKKRKKNKKYIAVEKRKPSHVYAQWHVIR